MKWQLVMGLVMALSYQANAEFGPNLGYVPNSLSRLSRAADALKEEVSCSPVRYSVKSSVNRFSRSVDSLLHCEANAQRLRRHSHPGSRVCSSCRHQLRQAKRAYEDLGDALYGIEYEFPRIARKFERAGRALRNVAIDSGSGGGGGGIDPRPRPSSYICVAVDRGWEEHRGGHPAFGRTLAEAKRKAIRLCEFSHGSCRISSCRATSRPRF